MTDRSNPKMPPSRVVRIKLENTTKRGKASHYDARITIGDSIVAHAGANRKADAVRRAREQFETARALRRMLGGIPTTYGALHTAEPPSEPANSGTGYARSVGRVRGLL